MGQRKREGRDIHMIACHVQLQIKMSLFFFTIECHSDSGIENCTFINKSMLLISVKGNLSYLWKHALTAPYSNNFLIKLISKGSNSKLADCC